MQDPSPDDTLSEDFKELSAFRMHFEILKMLEPFFGERILEWKGHFKQGGFLYGPYPKDFLKRALESSWMLHLEAEDLKRVREAVATGEVLPKPVEFLAPIREMRCPFCDKALRLAFDGKRLSVASEECPNPEGLITEWELNVPSGKLAIANDLREWFPTDEGGDLNTIFGIHLTILAYADVGMSHGFVGNSCPGVYRNDENKFTIGSYLKTFWDPETERETPNPVPCPWGKRVGGITTDLWWYSIADYDELKRRVKHYTPGKTLKDVLQGEGVKVLKVKPGVYKFRMDHTAPRTGPIVEYTTFEWVRGPDPLVDYLGLEESKSVTALEYLIENCLSWPTLFMDLGSRDREDRPSMIRRWLELTDAQRCASLARAADHLMVVIGNAVDWHEKGFPREKISEEARMLARQMGGEVPSFDHKVHWYPLSEGFSALCKAAGVRSPYHAEEEESPQILERSFVLLGLNICQSAIKFGSDTSLIHDVWPPAFDIPYCRERMKTYIKCYQGLRTKYPEIVFDTAFDRWMRETDLDEHVESFDFGPRHPPEKTWGPKPKTIKLGEYFEFDAKVIGGGHFCWHPLYMRGWASKEDAQRYCLPILDDEVSPMGFPYVKESGCGADKYDATLPLRVVGRVIRGTDDAMPGRHLEVAFDYGTADMQSQRWSIREEDMPAVRQFSDPKKYATLLEKYKEAFDREEAKIRALVSDRERAPKKRSKVTKKKATKKRSKK